MNEGIRIEMVDVERVILEEIAEKESTRDCIAATYAFCITTCEDIDIGKINRAIVERWSKSGLNYIKTEAWKLMEGK